MTRLTNHRATEVVGRGTVVALCAILSLAFGCVDRGGAGRGGDGASDGLLWRIQTSQGWGFIDSGGNVVVKPQYLQVKAFEGRRHIPLERHVVQRPDKTWVLVSVDGETPLYDGEDAIAAHHLGDSLYRIWRDLGDDEFVAEILDLQDRFAMPEGYTSPLGLFSDGRLQVQRDGKAGFADRDGRIIIPAIYDFVDIFSEGKAGVGISGPEGYLGGFVDTNGTMVIPLQPEFLPVGHFREDRALVYGRGSVWYITPDGKEAFPERFSRGGDFGEGLAAVEDRESGLWGYVDIAGNFVIPPRFEKASAFSGGLAAVSEGSGVVGFIDRTGAMKIPVEEESGWRVTPFSHGLAWIGMEGEPDSPGPPPYFWDPRSTIWKQGYYIDREGNVLWSNRNEHL